MKRKRIIRIHILASIAALLLICTFFTASLLAELDSDIYVIRNVKRGILYAIPLLLVTMPVLGISGLKLAGNSRHSLVLLKKRRMKFIALNGGILIFLAIFLFYWSHYHKIDGIYLICQIIELLLGAVNLSLIGMNIKDGWTLSGKKKLKKILS